MDGGTIVIKNAHVDKRAGAFYVQSFDSTAGKYPLFFQGYLDEEDAQRCA
jgi:hypothetical protein